MGFWGKLSDDRKSSLSLADHCIDVASVFRALCDLPAIRRSLGLGSDAIVYDRLAVFALLHDLGKCNAGFQARQDSAAKNAAGHVIETSALFCDEALHAKAVKASGLDELALWFDSRDGCYRMLLAALFHHGKPVYTHHTCDSNQIDRLKRHWQPRDSIDPFVGLRELGTTARNTFPSAFKENAPPIPVTIELEHRFAGLVMLADWLGSHREAFFPFEHEGNRIEWSRCQARQALAAVGLDVSAARDRVATQLPSFRDISGISGEPRPLQSALASTELPSLLIAESDTGSGKTEGALLHFLALFGAGMVDGLYFALPTRVAARELYERVDAAMKRVFGNDCPPVLLAVPGYTLVDGERADSILPTSAHLFHEEDQKQRDRTWAAERPKRFLAAPIAVGTIDQALFSTIQVPHAHLRAACLDRSLLVIDEVHSSDVYMRHLVRRLLRRHCKAGGRALLLSATLGAAARAEYLHPETSRPEAEPLAIAASLPYPAISAPEQPTRHLSDPASRSKTVQLEPQPALQAPETLLPRLREALIDPRKALCPESTTRFPRARGDRPFRRPAGLPLPPLPPRTRGSTSPPGVGRWRPEASPAHAGIDPFCRPLHGSHAIGTFVALLTASFIAPPGKPIKPPHVLAAQAVLDAPLPQVAALAGKDTRTLLTQLQAAGIDADADRSLRAASGPEREKQMQALGVAFAH